METSKKFHVLHYRGLWKSAGIDERSPPAEYAMIAAAHSQQNASVMGKAIR
jgi:hypothetical protein